MNYTSTHVLVIVNFQLVFDLVYVVNVRTLVIVITCDLVHVTFS